MTNDDRAAVEALVARLEAAWNAADPAAFAAEFTADADFVNVRGDYSSGRVPIAEGHAAIWKSIYAGSTLRYSLARLRALAPSVLLAHLDAHLRVPAGPLAGEISAIPSLVLVDAGGAWQIAAFHNTARAKT
jgi:uncharacterized protein (TIGR02246 family)